MTGYMIRELRRLELLSDAADAYDALGEGTLYVRLDESEPVRCKRLTVRYDESSVTASMWVCGEMVNYELGPQDRLVISQ